MYAACIIETRLIDLRPVIKRHFDYLQGFQLYLFTTEANKNYFQSQVNEFNGIVCTFKGERFTETLYNQLLTSVEFWEIFTNYKRVLVFQHDSGLLRKGIENYYEWDYIGSPWKFQKHGGNGGLSLRNPKLMKDICEKYRWHESLGNEDVFFCNIMNRGFGKLAPRVICSEFSCETIFALNTLGWHNIHRYLKPEQVEQILNQKH